MGIYVYKFIFVSLYITYTRLNFGFHIFYDVVPVNYVIHDKEKYGNTKTTLVCNNDLLAPFMTV